MALAVHQGDTSDPTNPVLVFTYIEPLVGQLPDDDAGFLANVESLTYRVLQPDGTEHVATTAVNLDDVDDGGHRIRTGTYAPPIVIDGADPTGVWMIQWVAQRVLPVLGEGGSPTYEWTTRFTVVDAAEDIPDGYALVSEARAQGIPAAFTDQAIFDAIERASRFVEEITRRFFEPRYRTTQHDGEGLGQVLMFDDPIIGLEDFELTFSDFRPTARLIERSQVRVYNRHIRPGALVGGEDDRESPKIEMLRVNDPLFQAPRFPSLNRRFTEAQQNVQVTGWFGYTEPDGSPMGRTPTLIQRVTMMLAMRDLRPLWNDFSGGRRNLSVGVLRQEKTRDQAASWGSSAEMAGGAAAGAITGDPEIDRILVMYTGPMQLAAV